MWKNRVMKKTAKKIASKISETISHTPSFSGHVDEWDGKYLSGWAVDKKNTDIKVSIKGDNQHLYTFIPSLMRKDLIEHKICLTGNAGFITEVNAHKLFSKGIKILDVVEEKTGRHLVGSPITIYPPIFKGNIEHQSSAYISGWVFDETYPKLNLEIDLIINGELKTTASASSVRLDLRDAGLASFHCGFNIGLGQHIDPLKVNRVELKLHGTNELIFDEITVLANAAKVDALLQLQNLAKQHALSDKNNELQWLSQDIIPGLIDQTRTETFAQQKVGFIRPLTPRVSKQITDIIIPVYKGLDETINCIKSVFSVKCDSTFNVFVINDCSPEPELTKQLRLLEKKLSFKLLENENNLGFVGTVNRGMKLSEDNDVLLLNSDTIVTNNWLDHIVNAAYSNNTIGTVTPFSNNATICSYPKFCADNELPKIVELNELSQVFSEVNKGKTVDLPTAHGFSMFIKRETLNDVGYFDEQKWGKGYAEENDFSLRSTRLGWRNVMAMDAFVHHLGAVSFAEDSSAFIAKNLAKLNGIYPDYPQAVQSFIKADPVRPYRNNVAMKLMLKEVDDTAINKEKYEGSILFISLTIGGGTEVATNDLSAAHRKNGQCVFMLTAPSETLWELRSLVDNAVVQYKLPQEKHKLIEDLQTLQVNNLHYHHTIQFPKSIWELPDLLSVPYDVTLHDYHSICPRVNLVDDTQSYCGEPNNDACNRCIKRNGIHDASLLSFDDLGGSIESWRAYYLDKLKSAKTVITPSHDTQTRILKYFDLKNIETRYHIEPEINYQPKPLNNKEVLNLVFIGAIGVHKGLNVLKECAEYAYKFDLPIKFIVIGYTSDDKYFEKLPNVTITGKYTKKELPSLIKQYDCHIAGLFSVWPETYSYTLSEALRANLHIAAFKLGAIQERCDIDFASCFGESPDIILKKLLGIK
tara:strand:+ start:15959 stop:18730 length:2772 start_codon:yes stop_codon:yes gene_type:complete